MKHFTLVILKFSDYTNVFVRQKSLADNEIGKELAELGAFNNKLRDNRISCFKCGLFFDIQKICAIADRGHLNFVEAGWFIHAKHHPWCKLLEQVHPSTLDSILGN